MGNRLIGKFSEPDLEHFATHYIYFQLPPCGAASGPSPDPSPAPAIAPRHSLTRGLSSVDWARQPAFSGACALW